MIPQIAITAWRNVAPWASIDQVEQDLILSRAICELYQRPEIRENLVFRGGTALHKLFFSQSGRYSEDLDFVQMHAKPIGDTVSVIRECLDPWLGKPNWKQNQGRFTMYYRYETESKPVVARKVKIEINTREHFNVLPLVQKKYLVENSWFAGTADVLTYSLEELMGTKLRALYQRKKGRDLYDYWYVKKHHALDSVAVIKIFQQYLAHENQSISRAEFEQNILAKQANVVFTNDIAPLLTGQFLSEYDMQQAFQMVMNDFASQLPGDAWKGNENG
jgi:predicted nucleotidyltransferase component of viral defense system